jgi:type IV pilus assembly protein PilE
MTRGPASGFSLIELMITVAIIGILASLAYPAYREAIRKAKRAEARAALLQLMQQEERFYSQNTRYIAFSADSSEADERKFKWYSGDDAATSAYEIMAKACDNETIQNCIMLTATPGTGKVNATFQDPICGSLTLTSTGVKGSSGSTALCWK